MMTGRRRVPLLQRSTMLVERRHFTQAQAQGKRRSVNAAVEDEFGEPLHVPWLVEISRERPGDSVCFSSELVFIVRYP